MSDRLLREADVIKAILENKEMFRTSRDIQRFAVIVGSIPAVDVELNLKLAYERGKTNRPQGEWIESFKPTTVKQGVYMGTKFVHDGWSCSECSEVVEKRYPNCPYCLARMKGADSESVDVLQEL